MFIRRSSSDEACLPETVKSKAGWVGGLFAEN